MPPELGRMISLIAEAKMHFILAAQGTAPGSAQRRAEIDALEHCNARIDVHLEALGGMSELPERFQVEIRVCALAVPKLRGAQPS